MPKDIACSDEGSWTTSDGDFVLVEPETFDRQLVNSRLQTMNPDWYYEPEIGSDLETLVGQPNTRQTAQAGEDLITRCLTFDRYFQSQNFTLTSMPVSIDSIKWVLFMNQSRTLNPMTPIAVGMYLKAGVVAV